MLAVEPETTVLCCDFDGTIADIVADPSAARVQPAAAAALTEMAPRYRTVAVISGRPVEFLRARLGKELSEALELYGRYGAEHLESDGVVKAEPPSSEVRARLAVIADEARRVAPGVGVEDKGGSLALHWRNNPELGTQLLELASSPVAVGLERRPGKLMVDLVVPGAPTKGSTFSRLLAIGVSRACFLGDDVGDLDAFDALDRLEASGGQGLRVAVGSSELPDALRDRADLVLRDPGEAAEFLAELAAATAR